jgi:hypothetical protein
LCSSVADSTCPPFYSYSKQALLGTAKTILDNNSKKYALTDSTSILQASMRSGMLQTMKSVRNLRSSFLSQAGGAPSGASTARTTGFATSLPAALAQVSRELRAGSVDEASAASSKETTSLGHLSADEALTRHAADADEEHAEEHDHEEEDDVDGEHEHTGDEAESDGEGYTASHEDHGVVTSAHGDHGGASSPLGNQGRLGGLDEQSVGENSLLAAALHVQAVMSPNAPAPSHIDHSVISGPSVEAQLNSLAPSDSPHAPLTPQPTRLPSHPPLEQANSQNSLDGGIVLGGSSTKKAMDAAALRMKELKEKIIAHAPSDALEQFNVGRLPVCTS